MSISRAMTVLSGERTDQRPLFDIPTHPAFLRRLTGLDPFANASKAIAEAIKKLDIDILMCSIPEQAAQDAAVRDLYDITTTDWRNETSTRKDIFTYDPANDRPGTPASFSSENAQAYYRSVVERNHRMIGDTALTIGYLFTTCIHYAAEDLDWPSFLMACAEEDPRIVHLLDRFEQASTKLVDAWAQTGVEIMLCHDDIAMATGTILSPDWIREHVVPRYERIWRPLKEKNIKILFMSDGNYGAIAPDLADIGADGFFIDTPCMDLNDFSEQCGKDKIYFTGISPAVMTTGTPLDITKEMQKLDRIAAGLPRFLWHMVGSWPHNIPLENVEAFYAFCRPNLKWPSESINDILAMVDD